VDIYQEPSLFLFLTPPSCNFIPEETDFLCDVCCVCDRGTVCRPASHYRSVGCILSSSQGLTLVHKGVCQYVCKHGVEIQIKLLFLSPAFSLSLFLSFFFLTCHRFWLSRRCLSAKTFESDYTVGAVSGYDS
jgi:hypothetical protein